MSTSAHQLERQGPLGQPLIARKHTDYGELEIPFYDEELGVPQGRPHKDVVFFIGDIFRRIAELCGLGFLADKQGIRRIEIHHAVVFQIDRWDPIIGGRQQKGIIKPDFQRPRFDIGIPIDRGPFLANA